MADGTLMRANIYRPPGSGTLPLLLQCTPYDKAAVENNARKLASRGYVVVVQDMRGRFESAGEYQLESVPNAGTVDGQDGFDTVE